MQGPDTEQDACHEQQIYVLVQLLHVHSVNKLMNLYKLSCDKLYTLKTGPFLYQSS